MIYNKQVVHSIGLFHTELTDDYTHCAYTQKVRRLISMLSYQGYHVIHYGAGRYDEQHSPLYAMTPDPVQYVELMSSDDLNDLRGYAKKELNTNGVFMGDIASTDTTLYKIFHHKLKQKVSKYYTGEDDIFLHHFGWPHQELGSIYPKAIHVEPGIGYPSTFAPYRIFESYAWMNYVLGQQKQMPQYGDFVIPNHFKEDDWEVGDKDRDGVCFMGRVCDTKGLPIIGEVSNVLDSEQFVIAGQVDPVYLDSLLSKYKNLEYVGELKGKQRNEFLQKFKVMMLPTQYFEPFGGAIIEGAMSGCVPVTSDFGVFPEIIPKIGMWCRTLDDYCQAVWHSIHNYDSCKTDRNYLDRTYGMYAISERYNYVLQTITRLHKHGWKGA